MKLIDLKYKPELEKRISNQIGDTVSQGMKDCLLNEIIVNDNILSTLVKAIKGVLSNFFLTMHQLSRDHQKRWVRISDEEASAKTHRVLTMIRNFLKKGGEE
jgi:hypothetical protein